MFFETWNTLAIDNNLKGFEFFAFIQGSKQLSELPVGMYDRIVYDALHDTYEQYSDFSFTRYKNAIKMRLGIPVKLANYSDYVSAAITRFNDLPNITPCIDPMFDHSPRSSNRSIILHNNSPKLWRELCKKTKEIVQTNSDKDNLLFIKAWNEWGEGNYMEPDSKYGKAYIEEAGKVFK